MSFFAKIKQKYIGTPAFYKMLLAILIPLVVRQGITNFVSLLDNVMVGQLSKLEMSAVSIDNQLIFIFNLAVFGGLSGAAIFSTQFFGSGDWKSMRDTFRFKLIFSLICSAVAIFIFLMWCEPLVMFFLKSEENTAAEIADTLFHAKEYMKIAVVGLLPFAIVQAYGGTLSEMGETKLPMYGGIVAIGVNLVFNYLLIYGKFGFPALGVRGAAIATVLSRFVEFIYVVGVTHVKREKYLFAKGVYRTAKVPLSLVKRIIITGTPLMLNEIMWSMARTFINRNYSLRGIDVIAATNITTTAWNLFCVIMFAFGTAVSIIVGQRLGAGDREGAIDSANKIIFATFTSQLVIGAIIIATAGLVPELYNVEPYVKELSRKFLFICGCVLPLDSIVHDIYFTIRSGGKTFITFLFDSVYEWGVPFTISYFLCTYTSIDITVIYFTVMFAGAIKLLIGWPMLRSGYWANTIVGDRVKFKKKKNER